MAAQSENRLHSMSENVIFEIKVWYNVLAYVYQMKGLVEKYTQGKILRTYQLYARFITVI